MRRKQTESRCVSISRSDGRIIDDPKSTGLAAAGAAVAARNFGEVQSVVSLVASGSGGPPGRPGRYGVYRSPEITSSVGGPPPTVYTWRWWIVVIEVSPGNWFVTVHAEGTWTGPNPPFNGFAIQIQTSATPNNAIVLRLDNTATAVDQPSNFGNPFGMNPPLRSGIVAWADSTEFTTYLVEFHPADTFVAVDPDAPVALLSFVQ